MLWGNLGAGKTFYSSCIANAVLNQNYTVMFTSASRLINEVQGIEFKFRRQYISSLREYDLLIVDDLGTEKNTEDANDILYNIINERYICNLPLIVSTNYDYDFMRNTTELNLKRIFDRVLEVCTPVQAKESSTRIDVSKTKRQKFQKDILGE